MRAEPGKAGHGNGRTSLRHPPLYLKDAMGVWRWTGEVDHSRWEVICPDCGDGGGRFETQSLAVRALRGPYRSKPAAQRAMERHTGTR